MSTQTHKKLTEVANTGPTSVATAPQAQQAPVQEVLAKDILIARLLNMQGLSDLVVDKKAQTGEFIRSTTEEKLGDDKAIIDFVPLKVTMEWMEKEKVGQKFEFRKMVARTALNDNAPWTFWRNPQGQEADKAGVLLGATEWKRVKVLNVYSLLPRDVDGFEAEIKRCADQGVMPDLTKTVLPVLISFKSTSYKAGQTVTTFFKQVDEMLQYNKNVKHYGYSLPLSCFLDKNDDGSFYVLKVGAPKALDAKYLPMAERWYNTLNSLKDLNAVVDTSHDDGEGQKEAGSY